MMFDLNGKTALVTGASGAIGGAIARALHAQGATVAISGTRKEVLKFGKCARQSRVCFLAILWIRTPLRPNCRAGRKKWG
jgi:3-oxoacyl-[acyl-carrier protein] reductase